VTAVVTVAVADFARAQEPSAEMKPLLVVQRRPLLERTLLAELSRAREDQGLPPLVWDERLAAALREHVAAMLQAGWTGGPAVGTPAGNATARSKSRHRYPAPEVFDNSSPQRTEDWSPTVVAEALIGAELMRSFRDPANTVGAAVVVEGKDGIFSHVAVAKADAAGVAAAEAQASATWLAVLGAPAAKRVEALVAHLPHDTAAAVPWLVDLLGSERDAAVKAAVAEALARTDSTICVEPLIAAMAAARGDAADVFGAALTKLTGQSHPDARAWDAWWKAEGPAFKLPPKAEGEPPAPPEPVDGAAALAGFKKAIRHGDPVLRAIACRGLGAAHADRAASTLAKALGDPDPEVQLAAVGALGELGDASALGALTKAWPLLMKSPRTALVAVRAAGQLGAKAAKLLERDPFSPAGTGVAVARCEALVALRDPKALGSAIALLAPLANKHGADTAKRVCATLASATGASPGDTPDAWTAWWSENKSGFTFPAPAGDK